METRNARHYTCMLLEKMDAGTLDAKAIVEAFCSFNSEDEVHDMMKDNEWIGEPCMECETVEELVDGLCDNCHENASRFFCDVCNEETDEQELDANEGYCNTCTEREENEREQAELEKKKVWNDTDVQKAIDYIGEHDNWKISDCETTENGEIWYGLTLLLPSPMKNQ